MFTKQLTNHNSSLGHPISIEGTKSSAIPQKSVKRASIFGAMAFAGALGLGSGSAFAEQVWDDFSNGFNVQGADGSGADNAKWTYFGAGPFVGNAGVESVSDGVLNVITEPTMTLTMAQEGSDENTAGMPGGFDHVKWLTYTNSVSSSGLPGFDAKDGEVLFCEGVLASRSFGTENHPFGDAVINHNDDLRLAAAALNTIDLESWMVFDFFITNETIYAFYERLPYGRDKLGNYAAFTFMVPVAERTPEDKHRLRISYDRAAGTVNWFVEGEEVFKVDRVGFLLDREHMAIDHGGDEPSEPIVMNQFNCGMGIFTLLDASLPSGKPLVRISNAPDFYFDPAKGQPHAATFVDEESAAGSRLFGQGVELKVYEYSAGATPAQ